MGIRFLLFAILTFGLVACDEPKKATEEKKTETQTTSRLEKDLSEAKGEIERLRARIQESYARYEDMRSGHEALAKLSFSTQGLKPFLGSIGPKVAFWKKAGGNALAAPIHEVAREVFGVYGSTAVVSALDTFVENPTIARAVYNAFEPAITLTLKQLLIEYGDEVIRPVLYTPYDPFIGLLASGQGHSCRWKLMDPSRIDPACTKVLAQIENHYNLPVTLGLIEVLGVLHRRREADGTPNKAGFNALLEMAKEAYLTAVK